MHRACRRHAGVAPRPPTTSSTIASTTSQTHGQFTLLICQRLLAALKENVADRHAAVDAKTASQRQGFRLGEHNRFVPFRQRVPDTSQQIRVWRISTISALPVPKIGIIENFEMCLTCIVVPHGQRRS